MKKSVFVSLAASAVLLLAACSSSPESLVTKYEKACENGKLIQAEKIASDLEKIENKLTESQIERIATASIVLAGKTMDKAGKAYDQLGKMFSDDDDDED